MNPTQLYEQLKDLAGKLNIVVTEQNMRATGVNARSGLCVVRGQRRFIMDKHLTVREKAEVLAECLRELPIEDIYIMPAIRKYLERS